MMKDRRFFILRRDRRRMARIARRCRDADERTRYRIVIQSAEGKSIARIADGLGCSESTVARTRRRWREYGEAGLIDAREDNAARAKVDAFYLETLRWLLQYTPPEFGHRSPRWNLRLIGQTAAAYTGVKLSRSRLSRWLKWLGVRRGRPKPTVRCPWSKRATQRRVRMLRRLIETLPANEAAVWEDEVDIELNPRIGADWMLPGQQREVETPGQNRKRYLAGAMDAQTDRVHWVRGEKKNSRLFIDLLDRLLKAYAEKRMVHVILDNYRIHSSRQTQAWLDEHGERIKLHFLPPYCPEENRIERRLWRELHRNVTYNHQCQTMEQLMREVSEYLRRYNLRIAWQPPSDLRKCI
ncbi:MAG: IS630 family transposase [Phycisphaeraceae bacterium]